MPKDVQRSVIAFDIQQIYENSICKIGNCRNKRGKRRFLVFVSLYLNHIQIYAYKHVLGEDTVTGDTIYGFMQALLLSGHDHNQCKVIHGSKFGPITEVIILVFWHL